MAPIKRSPVVGETLTVTLVSGDRNNRKVEYLRCEVIEVFAACVRIRLIGPTGCRQGILRVHVAQLSE